MNINMLLNLEGGWFSTEVTEYHVVQNIDIKQYTTALHHNKSTHATQETTECQKHGVLTEQRKNYIL
jgi:hypothetical protein